MPDKIYKNPVDLVEQEYKNISDEAIDLFGKGQRLSPEKQQRYDQVKAKLAAKAKAAPERGPIGITKEYKRKSDGHPFVLYPDTPDFLFSTQDHSGNSDFRLKPGQLDADFDFVKEYEEEQ